MGSHSSVETERVLSSESRLIQLSDEQLTTRLSRLLVHKRLVDARLLTCLSELDRRKLYREAACSSLFVYCVSRLGMSEDVAWKRVGAVRLIRRFPGVTSFLTAGRIHLTGLMLIAPHLTEANHGEWLRAAAGKSKREIEKLVAVRCPQPDVPSQIRKLPQRGMPDSSSHSVHENSRPCAVTKGELEGFGVENASSRPTLENHAAPSSSSHRDLLANDASNGLHHSEPAPVSATAKSMGLVGSDHCIVPMAPVARSASPNTQALRSQIQPLSEYRYRVVFTAHEALKLKLDRARELVSHAVSPSDLPGLIERALDVLIASEERRRRVRVLVTCKRRSTDSGRLRRQSRAPSQDPDLVAQEEFDRVSPRESVESRGETQNTAATNAPHRRSRYVPAAIARQVWQRDAGQCTYVDDGGSRCENRCFLQLDHVQPHAAGGLPTVTNLRLRCQSHNLLEAERAFGRDKIQRAIQQSKQR